jgi:VWFA-related protein
MLQTLDADADHGVSLVRVDVQVVDHNNRSITGLNADDFVLREQGHPQQICNFVREDMPVDLLFLFDVSGSMQAHVKRIASAAHEALRGLGDNDRVAIMVFERTMRERMPFRNSRQEIDLELDNMIRQEPFHGGTDITRALVLAASYLEVQARTALSWARNPPALLRSHDSPAVTACPPMTPLHSLRRWLTFGSGTRSTSTHRPMPSPGRYGVSMFS